MPDGVDMPAPVKAMAWRADLISLAACFIRSASMEDDTVELTFDGL
jgi:hypothetical protein